MKKIKNAEEYFKQYVGYKIQGVLESEDKSIIEAIKQAQLDAIQITVEMCAEEAKFSITENALIEAKELYDYYDDGAYTYSISNSSILNVANKLKEELK